MIPRKGRTMKTTMPRDTAKKLMLRMVSHADRNCPKGFPGCEALEMDPNSLEAAAYALACQCAESRRLGTVAESLEGILTGWIWIGAIDPTLLKGFYDSGFMPAWA